MEYCSFGILIIICKLLSNLVFHPVALKYLCTTFLNFESILLFWPNKAKRKKRLLYFHLLVLDVRTTYMFPILSNLHKYSLDSIWKCWSYWETVWIWDFVVNLALMQALFLWTLRLDWMWSLRPSLPTRVWWPSCRMDSRHLKTATLPYRTPSQRWRDTSM